MYARGIVYWLKQPDLQDAQMIYASAAKSLVDAEMRESEGRYQEMGNIRRSLETEYAAVRESFVPALAASLESLLRDMTVEQVLKAMGKLSTAHHYHDLIDERKDNADRLKRLAAKPDFDVAAFDKETDEFKAKETKLVEKLAAFSSDKVSQNLCEAFGVSEQNDKNLRVYHDRYAKATPIRDLFSGTRRQHRQWLDAYKAATGKDWFFHFETEIIAPQPTRELREVRTEITIRKRQRTERIEAQQGRDKAIITLTDRQQTLTNDAILESAILQTIQDVKTGTTIKTLQAAYQLTGTSVAADVWEGLQKLESALSAVDNGHKALQKRIDELKKYREQLNRAGYSASINGYESDFQKKLQAGNDSFDTFMQAFTGIGGYVNGAFYPLNWAQFNLLFTTLESSTPGHGDHHGFTAPAFELKVPEMPSFGSSHHSHSSGSSFTLPEIETPSHSHGHSHSNFGSSGYEVPSYTPSYDSGSHHGGHHH